MNFQFSCNHMIVGVSQPLSKLNDKNCNLRISSILAKWHDKSATTSRTGGMIGKPLEGAGAMLCGWSLISKPGFDPFVLYP